MGIPDHLTCLLRNLYAGQEATARNRCGTMDKFKIGKEYIKAIYCHSAYLSFMQSTAWKLKTQARIKMVVRNINNLRYAEDTTLMAESEEKLRSLLMRVKESEKSGLKLNIQNNEYRGIWSHHFMVK